MCSDIRALLIETLMRHSLNYKTCVILSFSLIGGFMRDFKPTYLSYERPASRQQWMVYKIFNIYIYKIYNIKKGTDRYHYHLIKIRIVCALKLLYQVCTRRNNCVLNCVTPRGFYFH